MSERDRKDNIIKVQNRLPLTFARILMVLILAYLIVQAVVLIRRKPLEAYQVGAPSSENISGTFNGVILRDEISYYADGSAYVNYMLPEGARLQKGEYCCLLDRNGNFVEKLHEIYYNQDILTDASKNRIREAVLKAAVSYDPLHFDTALDARTELHSALLTGLLNDGSEDLFDRLEDVSYDLQRAGESGFLLYYEDGYESRTPDQLTSADFSAASYIRTSRSAGEQVEAEGFLYKIAPGNGFRLCFPMTESDVLLLQSKKNLSVRMQNGMELTGSFEIVNSQDGQTGVIHFQKYGVNFLNDRIVSFRILDRSVKGFRIPESALTKKSFFVVSNEYITEGGPNGAKGVVLQTNEGLRFTRVTVYQKNDPDEESFIIGDGVAYIAGDELKAGTVLVAESIDPVTGNQVQHVMMLGVMASCEGVYQINQGYSVFKPVVRLEHSLESSYVIVSARSRYGISAYDRILLNAEGVGENEFIFE